MDLIIPRPLMRLTGESLSSASAILAIAANAQAAPSEDRESEQLFPHAFAMRGCTQEDAPAVEIYLTQTPFDGEGDPAVPYIRFEISSPLNEAIGPVSLELVPLRRDPNRPGRIARAELEESVHTPTWLSGTIALDEATPGRRVAGHYDVTTPTGRRLKGSFVTGYSTRSTVCG